MRPEVGFQVRALRVHLLAAGILALVYLLGGVRRQLKSRVIRSGRGDGHCRHLARGRVVVRRRRDGGGGGGDGGRGGHGRRGDGGRPGGVDADVAGGRADGDL